MAYRIFTHALLSSLFATSLVADYIDDFSKPELKSRFSERGTWSFKDRQAHCKWDSSIITVKKWPKKTITKKSATIGWKNSFNEGVMEFEVKTKDIKLALIGFVNYTDQKKSHVFFIHMAKSSYINAWPEDLKAGEHKSKQKKERLTVKEIPGISTFKDGEWTKVKFSFKGKKATLQIGGHSAQIEHAAFSRRKDVINFHFTEGEVRLRNFKITPVEKKDK